jgi:hypothetical protein
LQAFYFFYLFCKKSLQKIYFCWQVVFVAKKLAKLKTRSNPQGPKSI